MIYHCFTAYSPKDPDTIRRNELAQRTWTRQAWHEIPVRDEDLPRMWTEKGVSRPFIKDVLSFACKNAQPNDIIIYSNADILCSTDCSMRVVQCLQQTDACYAFRRDFKRLDSIPDDSQFKTGSDYPGSDLYAFRRSWWDSVAYKMPDMILGLEFWDSCFRVLIHESNPGEVTIRDIICHERHSGPTHWERSEHRYKLEGQHYCLKLGVQFMRSRHIDPTRYGIPGWYIRQRRL